MNVSMNMKGIIMGEKQPDEVAGRILFTSGAYDMFVRNGSQPTNPYARFFTSSR